MNYEEKYKQALERARKLHSEYCTIVGINIPEEIFPELQEENDERIRKELIAHCRNIRCVTEEGAEQVKNWITWLEKQGEHKPSDKTEPKFKVGDWITDGYVGGLITSIEDNYPCYKIADFMGGINTSIPFTLQDNYHLWTINDAKDGDVLVTGSNIFIFHFINDTRLMGYCHVNIDNELFLYDDIGRNECFCLIDAEVTPSTKEQRDLLFEKMKEAGYEWDSEKKELKTIEQIEPKFKVRDWIANGGANPCYVKSIFGDYYELCSCEGFDYTKHIIDVNYIYHLWTIDDAKDGDVLVTEDYIFIFKYILHGGVHLYCHYNFDDEEFDSDIPDAVIGNIHDKGIHFRPATKEQRDLLFEKMKEAGYEWDAEKKELKKIEPKFHEGEWITNGYYTWKIVEVKPLDYILQSQDGNIVDDTISYVDEQFHLWIIQDAKDGDVLAINWNEYDDSFEKIIIFKKYHNKGVKGLYSMPCVEGYGNTFKNGKLAYQEEVPYYSKTWTDNLHPATKEQCDLLFEEMTQAGYEWDAEKKELKKIEPKTLDSDVLQELNKLKEEIKELKEEIKNLNNRRRWK